MTILTCPKGTIEFGKNLPTLLVNNQLMVMDRDPEVLEELLGGKFECMLQAARRGAQVGVDMVDILITYPGVNEVDLLPKIAVAVSREIGCPVSLDTRDPEALSAALEALRPYKAMVNSVTAESEVLGAVLPVVKKYGAAVIGMPMGKADSMPRTVEARVEEAHAILKAIDDCGIPRDDVVMDGIVLASSAEPDSMQVTLETLKIFEQELDLTTFLGIQNAGHGMPTPTIIDLAFLLMSIPWGLHAALVHIDTPVLIEAVRAADFLAARDMYGKRYIERYRSKRKIN